MTPSDARNLAIDYGRKREMYLACDNSEAAHAAKRLQDYFADFAVRLTQSESSSPTSSLDETKQAGAIPPRLRPAPIPAEPDTSVSHFNGPASPDSGWQGEVR